MNIIAISIFIVLTIYALLHLIWANGIYWPAKNEHNLVKAVIGEPNMRHMPSRKQTYIIALALLLSSIFALWGGNVIALPLPLWIRELGVFLLAFFFATRGMATFMIAKKLGKKTQPFKTLDRALYAPLSIVISIGYIIFLINP